MGKLYFSPRYPKGKASNPYCDNYIDSIKEHFLIIARSKYHLPRGLELLINSMKADVFILNWIEGISSLRGGGLQAAMSVFALIVIHFRRKKIVWMFHNIHPHEGENLWSRVTQNLLFKWSSLIVSHSKEAADYAKQKANCPVFFKSHPIKRKEFGEWEGNLRECDFYIWGDIYPYKGVTELLYNKLLPRSSAQFYIVGKATTEDVEKQIENGLTSNVLYENRRAEYREIAAQCKKAKYVLFPYVGESISSSGVLMDTLMMGGTPVGPNRGAFADLASQGCCITYENIREIFDLPMRQENCLRLDYKVVEKFIDENSWNSFGKWIVELIDNL